MDELGICSIFKLTTGETLMGEYMGELDGVIVISNPVKVTEVTTNQGVTAAYSEWLPQCNTELITLPESIVYYTSPLTSKFAKIYGKILFQITASEMQRDFVERMQENNSHEFERSIEMIHVLKSLRNYFEVKFDIELPPIDEVEEEFKTRFKNIIN